MSFHVKLYACMTIIFENMTKILKNDGKMRFLEQKCAQNGISKFDSSYIFILKIVKNVFDSILFTFRIFGHHMPKIIDQTEISGALRASNQQHLSQL